MNPILIVGGCGQIGRAIARRIFNSRFYPTSVCRCRDDFDAGSPDKMKMMLGDDRLDGLVMVAEAGAGAFQNVLSVAKPLLTRTASVTLISTIHHLTHDDDYARSKRRQEAMLLEWGGHFKARSNILRLGHIVGTKAWPAEDASRLPEIPAGRFGTPEEVGDAVLFILSSEWLWGSVITLDGGISSLAK